VAAGAAIKEERAAKALALARARDLHRQREITKYKLFEVRTMPTFDLPDFLLDAVHPAFPCSKSTRYDCALCLELWVGKSSCLAAPVSATSEGFDVPFSAAPLNKHTGQALAGGGEGGASGSGCGAPPGPRHH
jgi:hypothetical protein